MRTTVAAFCVLLLMSPGGALVAQTPSDGPPAVRVRSVRDADLVRGVWVTRWEYDSPTRVATIMSRAAALGLTDVFFQVRGQADAFYRSSIEPWSAELTGRLGADPGWDPLATAVTEAHARGLRLHAWINTFPIWSGDAPPPESIPRHAFLEHPEWIMADRSGRTLRLGNRFAYVSASPGNPEVQDRIKAVVLDIVGRYPVDGVHFDYIRLPDDDYSYDAVSRGRYLSDRRYLTYMQWQTDQITGMLRRTAVEARALRADLLLSAAIINHYDRAVRIFAQDPVAWTDAGVLDYVIPMAYTPEPAEFAMMTAGYLQALAGERVVMGINLDEMPGAVGAVAFQVRWALESGTRGHVFFSLAGLERLARGMSGAGSSGHDLYASLEERVGVPFTVPVRDVPALGEEPTGPTPEQRGLRRALLALAAALSRVVLLIP